MEHDAPPLAAVLLAHGVVQPSRVQAAADAARAVGALTIVVVLRRGDEAPTEMRVARTSAGASTISAIRAGMALLTNTTARLALVWPLRDSDDSSVAALDALVTAARGEGGAVTAFALADLDHSAVIVARDAWLDLVTVGEQGIGAVAARRGLVLVPA